MQHQKIGMKIRQKWIYLLHRAASGKFVKRVSWILDILCRATALNR